MLESQFVCLRYCFLLYHRRFITLEKGDVALPRRYFVSDGRKSCILEIRCELNHRNIGKHANIEFG